MVCITGTPSPATDWGPKTKSLKYVSKEFRKFPTGGGQIIGPHLTLPFSISIVNTFCVGNIFFRSQISDYSHR